MSADNEDYVDSPELARNPSPPPELEENREAVFGDSIGQTAFSKHWLFTTLMKLIQEVDKESEGKDPAETEFGVDVDEDLQNELCKLWDMSMNAEIAQFLQEFKAVEILSGVIGKSKAPRVTEICVGILGNMACDDDICRSMSDNEKLVKMIIVMLENPDPPTLIETTRLLYTCLSKTESCQAWLSVIKQSDDVAISVRFILQSSTNSELLKNTAQFLDAVMDQDEELCKAWATQEFVESLLEAVKQVGYSHSETLETFLHVFQLISTSEEGVQSLVSCADDVLVPLMKYLLSVCEYEIVGLEGHESCLASGLSVLNGLYTSAQDVTDRLVAAPDLIRYLLKILEPLFPLLEGHSWKLGIRRSESNEENHNNTEVESGFDDNKNSTSGEDGDKEKSSESSTATDEGKSNNLNSEETGGSESTFDVSMVTESRKHRLLYNILQGFLLDFVTSLKPDDEEGSEDNVTPPLFLPVLRYLDASCSRQRINCMLLTLQEAKTETFNPADHIMWLAEKYRQERLTRIVKDFGDGNIYT